MGKQVRFYMLAADEQAFLQFVCQNQAVRLLSARSSGPKMQILEVPFTPFQRRVQLDIILLWNTAFPLRDSDIKEARLKAKFEGREIMDGEVTPACVQTCPADALIFGNLLDPKSRVSRLILDPRAYQVLEHLNTKPAVIYLKKIDRDFENSEIPFAV